MRLKSGRQLEIGGGGNEVIGLSADLKVFAGYDDGIGLWPDDPSDEHPDDWWRDELPLTTAERLEICDMMIARWQALRDKVSGNR